MEVNREMKNNKQETMTKTKNSKNHKTAKTKRIKYNKEMKSSKKKKRKKKKMEGWKETNAKRPLSRKNDKNVKLETYHKEEEKQGISKNVFGLVRIVSKRNRTTVHQVYLVQITAQHFVLVTSI